MSNLCFANDVTAVSELDLRTSNLAFSDSSSRHGMLPKRRRAELSLIDFPSETFAEEQKPFHLGASKVLSLNVYMNGVTLSEHSNLEPIFFDSFHLRFKETKSLRIPEGRHFLFKDDILQSLEARLAAEMNKGLLQETVVYFGTISDPFLSFQSKFDLTRSCLKLFERYPPARIVLQTRSPMLLSALPTLVSLSKSLIVAVPVETPLESVVRSLTPRQPRISERLSTCGELMRRGLPVCIQVSPILPYGKKVGDVWSFAELLNDFSNRISFGSLFYGLPREVKEYGELPFVKKIRSLSCEEFLRPYCFADLYRAVSVLSPEKLKPFPSISKGPVQLDFFAA